MSRPLATPDDGGIATIAETAAYRELIGRLKQRVRESQARAARKVNAELVMLYWSIGRDILVQQQANGWGDGVVERISQDLTAEVGGTRGFSRRSLFYMRRFAALWPDCEKVLPLVAQIGWSLHRVLLDRFGDQPDVYLWYVAKAAENRWSKRYLQTQVSLRLHEREGAALTNFTSALEPDDAGRALAAMKDPYILDFLDLAEDARERQLEQAILDDIQRFLLELGSGFALYGRQTPLFVGDEEFFLDLLFYHHTLRRFVVIDLKIGTFKVEHVGKMNFYLNAVDQQLRHDDDRDSVGIILCTNRNEPVAKLALHRVHSPIAVSTWQTDRPTADLPPAKDGHIPTDSGELAHLDDIRAQLADRVARHLPAEA